MTNIAPDGLLTLHSPFFLPFGVGAPSNAAARLDTADFEGFAFNTLGAEIVGPVV